MKVLVQQSAARTYIVSVNLQLSTMDSSFKMGRLIGRFGRKSSLKSCGLGYNKKPELQGSGSLSISDGGGLGALGLLRLGLVCHHRAGDLIHVNGVNLVGVVVAKSA